MGQRMVDESTLNLMVILHGTTQTRWIGVPKATDNAFRTLNNISCPFPRSFTIVWHQSCPQSTARFIQPIQRENIDLPPTNQNTRSQTRRCSTSCILVAYHGHDDDKHPRRLKSPINSIFIVLDVFYHSHFAFPFGLPTVPYLRGGPNVQRRISPTKHPPNPSSRVHPSFHGTTTATQQGQHRI